MGRNAYYIKYKMYSADIVHGIGVVAGSKDEAWDVATYEAIPRKHEGEIPYSAWVSSVTYQNGNCRYFNTHEGKPY